MSDLTWGIEAVLKAKSEPDFNPESQKFKDITFRLNQTLQVLYAEATKQAQELGSVSPELINKQYQQILQEQMGDFYQLAKFSEKQVNEISDHINDGITKTIFSNTINELKNEKYKDITDGLFAREKLEWRKMYLKEIKRLLHTPEGRVDALNSNGSIQIINENKLSYHQHADIKENEIQAIEAAIKNNDNTLYELNNPERNIGSLLQGGFESDRIKPNEWDWVIGSSVLNTAYNNTMVGQIIDQQKVKSQGRIAYDAYLNMDAEVDDQLLGNEDLKKFTGELARSAKPDIEYYLAKVEALELLKTAHVDQKQIKGMIEKMDRIISDPNSTVPPTKLTHIVKLITKNLKAIHDEKLENMVSLKIVEDRIKEVENWEAKNKLESPEMDAITTKIQKLKGELANTSSPNDKVAIKTKNEIDYLQAKYDFSEALLEHEKKNISSVGTDFSEQANNILKTVESLETSRSVSKKHLTGVLNATAATLKNPTIDNTQVCAKEAQKVGRYSRMLGGLVASFTGAVMVSLGLSATVATLGKTTAALELTRAGAKLTQQGVLAISQNKIQEIQPSRQDKNYAGKKGVEAIEKLSQKATEKVFGTRRTELNQNVDKFKQDIKKEKSETNKESNDLPRPGKR